LANLFHNPFSPSQLVTAQSSTISENLKIFKVSCGPCMGNPSSLLRDAWQNFAGHHFAFFIPDLAKALSLRYRILLSSLEIIDGKFRLSLRYRGLFFARFFTTLPSSVL